VSYQTAFTHAARVLYQGMAFTHAAVLENKLGFSPCLSFF
jgi:hypothetical protein